MLKLLFPCLKNGMEAVLGELLYQNIPPQLKQFVAVHVEATEQLTITSIHMEAVAATNPSHSPLPQQVAGNFVQL